MICPYCRESIKTSYLKMTTICQACYLYLKQGGKVHALPDAGTIVTDERDYVICHLCGQSYKKLGSHIANKHNMLVEDYKEQFNIPQKASLASKEHILKMRNYNNMYRDTVVYDNLINKGHNTRFTAGQVPLRKHNKKNKCLYVSLANADTENTFANEA